ncbi:MAG: polyprenyl synthetase family protein [Candidatus Woesebacteria bacterium]|nr:polyprenyl synthetase family protein [Candidatus Woesebacteria bacterium]
MIEDTLEKTKKLVLPEIEKYLKDPLYPKQFLVPFKFNKEVSEFWKINKIYPERMGKYLRPTLVRLVASAMGSKSKKIIKLASAIQLSEEWILIHDDIEDNSEKRRGAPTLHKLFGTELALNAGDSLHIIMWKIVSDINSQDVTNEFYKILLRTTLGQGVEQIWTNLKKKVTDDEYFFVADSKSAYYSIAGPMRLGAIISGANNKQLDKLTEFGLYLGRCFQLVDDILDLKQDKKEGKSTLVINKGVSYTNKLIEEYREKALNILNNDLKFLSHEPAKSKLQELLNFIVYRKY